MVKKEKELAKSPSVVPGQGVKKASQDTTIRHDKCIIILTKVPHCHW